MNNENKKQDKLQQDIEVPKDLLILVKHTDPIVENNDYSQNSSSEDNKFIKNIDNNKLNQKNSPNEITNTKLNVLLGTHTIVGANNLENSNNKINTNKTENKIKVEEKPILNQHSSNKSNNASGMNLDTLMKNTYNSKIELEKKTEKSNKIFFVAAIGSAVVFIAILMFAIFSGGINFSFRGKEAYYQDKTIEKTSEFQTSVVTDNIYNNVTINDKNDAKALIVKDGTNQKSKCQNDKVKEIETRIEAKYEIIAVNLCELDYKFALEIEKILDNIHKEFPSTIKGYLTNLSLSNMGEYGSYAMFNAVKLFAKSNTLSTYPNVYKTSIFLNAEYFLNVDRLTAEIEQSEGTWFVRNATKSSLVAHEFGHYLSFVAQLNNTNDINEVILLTRKNYSSYFNLIKISNEGDFSFKIINEAYENFCKKNPDKYSDMDDFRSAISEYAIFQNEDNEYIYDETIAEAYHDWYLNKNKAADASKEIVSVLKKYINN